MSSSYIVWQSCWVCKGEQMNRNELCPITVFTLEWAPPTNEWRTVLSDPKHNTAPIDFFVLLLFSMLWLVRRKTRSFFAFLNKTKEKKGCRNELLCTLVGYIKNNCRLKKPVNTGPDKCLNGQIFTCATSFNGMVQVVLEVSVMLAGSGVSERRFRESFFPFKNLPGPP